MVLTQWETLYGLFFFAFFEKIVVPILTSGGLAAVTSSFFAALYRDAAVAASTGDIPSVRHRVQHAWRYAWWTVLHSGKESTRKAVKIENNMIYWGKRD